MERTTMQNRTFYFAQNKVAKRRSALFRRLRTRVSKQGPDIRRQMTLDESFIVRLLHQDNGR